MQKLKKRCQLVVILVPCCGNLALRGDFNKSEEPYPTLLLNHLDGMSRADKDFQIHSRDFNCSFDFASSIGCNDIFLKGGPNIFK